jgi:hypothetical protein
VERSIQHKPATINQPAVFFSQNKPAPTISHQPTEQAVNFFNSFMLDEWIFANGFVVY